MAGTQFRQIIAKSFALIFLVQTAAPAESFLEKVQALYRAGNYGKAAECLQEELQRNQYDPQAHYLLGNCYLECRRYSEAAREYSAAIAIQPKGTVSDYCHSALSRLQSSGAIRSTSISNVQNPQQRKADVNTGSGAGMATIDQSESKQMQGSAEKISTQSKEHENRYSVECEARIRDVKRDLDLQIQRLTREMNDNLAAPSLEPYITSNGRGRTIRYVDGSKAPNEKIKAEYAQKIEDARAKAADKIADLKATLKTQQMATEDSAITIDRDYAYANRNKQANVKIAPSGTNIFVRNYETSDEPSGNAVPVALPPAKALQPAHKTSAK